MSKNAIFHYENEAGVLELSPVSLPQGKIVVRIEDHVRHDAAEAPLPILKAAQLSDDILSGQLISTNELLKSIGFQTEEDDEVQNPVFSFCGGEQREFGEPIACGLFLFKSQRGLWELRAISGTGAESCNGEIAIVSDPDHAAAVTLTHAQLKSLAYALSLAGQAWSIMKAFS